MKAGDTDFRQVYHKICFIAAGKAYKELTEHLPNHDDGNGTLVYGYVDHHVGLTYEILACAVRDEKGVVTSFDGDDAVSLKMRSGSVSDDDLYIVDDDTMFAKKFSQKIESIDKYYRTSDAVEMTRKIKEIDGSRNLNYPDDVLVILLHGENDPEGCWVRCERIENGMLVGELLNEPDSDFTVHRGDMISFGITKMDDGIICVAML